MPKTIDIIYIEFMSLLNSASLDAATSSMLLDAATELKNCGKDAEAEAKRNKQELDTLRRKVADRALMSVRTVTSLSRASLCPTCGHPLP